MPNPIQISYSLSDIGHTAHQFWQYGHNYRIFAFNGDMGAGKTTFIHALCDMLGVQDNVSSPTFALVNEYLLNEQVGLIYHMDWYRLKDVEEALQAGIEDSLDRKDAICFIEWPEKALDLLPLPYVWVNIELVADEERKMTIEIRGAEV